MREFILDDKIVKRIVKWLLNHECTIDDEGAIGGKITYTFTPTGLGDIVKCKCACGKEIDVTEYEKW